MYIQFQPVCLIPAHDFIPVFVFNSSPYNKFQTVYLIPACTIKFQPLDLIPALAINLNPYI
jgi:hypothetical protein